MLGQQILETNNKQIDFSRFEKGTYILVVQNLESGNTTNFKIINEYTKIKNYDNNYMSIFYNHRFYS